MPQSITISRRAYTTILVIAILGAVLVWVSGCAKFTEPFKDSPVSGHQGAPALIVEMPDGFSNFATKCIARGVRAATTYHGDKAYGAVTMIIDPNCK